MDLIIFSVSVSNVEVRERYMCSEGTSISRHTDSISVYNSILVSWHRQGEIDACEFP